MSRKMLINATHPEEHRVAIVEDGYLTELDIEITSKEQTRGNIYKAAVIRVESGLQAAFVDYGGERLGFLQISELHPNLYPSQNEGERRGRPRINDILRPGQEILVQVTKEERGTKGAALTTYLSLAGRYMVLMPESPTKGVSRKIEAEGERKKLKKAMAELDLPENMGYIVRTAGIGKSPDELRRDFDNLVEIHRGIQERAQQAKAPCLIFRESNLIIRCIRDYFTEDTEEVLVDDPVMYEAARDFFRMLMPDKERLVKLHQERRPIFSRYQIEEQIETINHNKVNLPSGGSIVLDTTEALVAVDVNSGKMSSEQGIEATAYKTNLEAAEEIGRQLRLRDLAGLIVIDFIDMRDRKNIRAVEKQMRDALKKDKSRVSVGRISQFGLLEMSRQRLKPNLAAASYRVCPQCQGHGQIKSVETQGLAFLRRIQAAAAAKGLLQRIEGRLPLEVADYLLNFKREEITEMERRYNMEIILHGRADLLSHDAELNTVRREKEDTSDENGDIVPIDLVSHMDAIQTELAEEDKSGDSLEQPREKAEEQTSGENSGGSSKKRRRRRRKKPAAAASNGSEANQESAQAAPETPDDGKPAAADERAPAAAAAPPAATPLPADEKQELTSQKPPQVDSEADTNAGRREEEQGKKDDAEQSKTAPRRTRAPRRRKPAKTSPEQTDDTKGEVSTAASAGAAVPEKIEQSENTLPTEKPSTPPAAPAAASSPLEPEQQTKQDTPPAPETQKGSAGEDAPAAPRRKRGRPRKTAAAATGGTAEAPVTTESSATPPVTTESEETPPAKPAPRRRTPRKTATAPKTEDTDKPTEKKTARKKAPAAVKEDSSSEAKTQEASQEEKKAPSTSRARRATTARAKSTTKTNTTEENAPEHSSPAPDTDKEATPKKKAAPKTRPRRTASRTKKTEEAPASSPKTDPEKSEKSEKSED